MKTESVPINMEDLAIAQECTGHAHRLRKTADGLREQIANYREEIKRCGDAEVRSHLLQSIVFAQDRATMCDARADIWADEAERWASGIK
jgi:hypothetical protein